MDVRKESLPRKKVAMKILSAYGGGVTNVIEGVEYTAFGREQEVKQFSQTLKMTKNGSGSMDAYIGPYGVGKSFVLALFKTLAIKEGFVVMNADITRHCWLSGTKYDKQGLNLYRELIKSTAIKGMGMGAFDIILQRWYADLFERTGGSLSMMIFEFNRMTLECNTLTMYDDIRNVIITRFKEIYSNADRSEAMNWLLANITKKTDAALSGAKDYIHESGWFDILNTWSHLFVTVSKYLSGDYKGLIVMIDPADYLLNLPKVNRQQNYEFILSMWNMIRSGKTEYLSVCLFAADNLLDNELKGTGTYEPVDQRLRSATRLERLNDGELVGLLERLKDIHEFAFGWESNITRNEIIAFSNKVLNSLPMGSNCVRPLSIAWMKYLDKKQTSGESDYSKYVSVAKDALNNDLPPEDDIIDD